MNIIKFIRKVEYREQKGYNALCSLSVYQMECHVPTFICTNLSIQGFHLCGIFCYANNFNMIHITYVYKINKRMR